MSWEDYKKKRNPDNTIQENENTNSTWENYKKNRTQPKINNQNKQNEEIKIEQKSTTNSDNLINKIGYVLKKGGTGILSGITGMAQAGLTDTANNLQKGNNKSGVEVANNLLETTSGILNPMQNYNKYIKNLPSMIGNTINTINDKDSNTIEKITSLGTTALSDALSNNTARNILDSGVQLAGKILPSDVSEKTLEINKNISEPIDKINQNLYLEGQNYDKATQFIGDATQSVGNMVPSIVATAITKNPNIGLLTMGISAKGQSTQEALNKGATLNEAIKIGDTKGAIEVATEMLTGGVNVFGKGALDDIVEKGIKDKVKNKVGKYLLQKGYQLGGEVLEETISDILGTTIDKGTVDPDATYSIEDWGDTAVTTILSTLILNAITGGIGKVNNYIINNVNNQNNVLNTNNKTETQQVTPIQNKMSQNQTSEQMQLPIRNYQYTETDNKKVNNLRQDMSKYWTDTNETKALGSVIEKIITDKGYNVRLDNTIKNQKGNSVNAQITTLNNGEVEIRINPNAKNVGEFLLMHETTHAIGTQEMKDLVMDYASKNTEFNNALESLKDTYGVQDVSDEVLADISGQLFGNQEFINNLSMEKPNIFKRIYNKIIELANKITGNSNEALFVRNLANKWQEAYRTQNNNLNNNSYYSIQTDNNGNKYVKVDTDQHIFDGIDKKDYNKIAKMYMQDYLMGKTILSNNDNAIIDRKSINKYTNPGIVQNKFTEKMKLTPELKNALQISEKVSQKLPIKINSKYSNWEYYKFKFELDGNNFEGLINIGIDNDGNKHFYEINNIKKTSISGTSLNNRTGLSNNSILPTNKDVNSTTKYSMQESENNSQLSEEAKKQLHRYINMNKKELNIAFSDAIENKENMLMEYNRLSKEYKEFQSTEDFMKALKNEDFDSPIWDRAGKYADKLRYYNEQYKKYKAQQDAINSILMETKTDTRNSQQIVAEVEKHFGVTNNFKETAYIDINGNQIDFSGKHEGGMSGSRSLDHRQINEINIDMQSFIDMGNIRIIPEGNGINLSVEPNDKQYAKLSKYIDNVNGEIYIDIDKTNTTYDSAEYKVGTSTSKIISDIQYYFKNGEFPRQSDLAQFRYSIDKSNSKWQQHLNNNYKATGTKTNLEDIKLPTKEYFENNTVKNTQNIMPIPEKKMQDIGLPPSQNNTVGEEINWNEIERPEGKFRKHYRSIIESSNTTTEAKKIAKEVMRQDTYIPDSNTKQLQKADERISMSGADAELNSMMSKAINNEKITAVDVAVGERLIEYYSKTGDAQKLQDAIQTTAMVGTQLGQAVQAMSILNHQTPQGQVVWIQRCVDKMNNELRQKRGENAPQFNLTDDMIQTILHSENEQQMNENLDIVYKELGQQVHKSTIEKLDSWRYFAMLGNFRTHIRNMSGNFLMGIAQDAKNKVAGTIEGTVAKFNPNMERTQTIKIPSKKVMEFAKNDIQNVLAQLEGNNKYNPKNALESNMRTFKSDVLENTLGRMFDWNDNLLEAEDALGLKSGYKKALTQYITANNLDVNNITDKQLAKARNYAIKQAQERTFHQANTIASAINSFTRKNKVTKAIGDAILPFVKTPANVAKTGIEYSPVGLSKAIIYDTVQLRKGNINVNQYIDNLSKGLTGSAITVLGYALAQAGILKAGGSDDDKKEKFDEQSGKQAYSIQVGDKTYSIDWLAPVGIPLMVGAEIYEGLTQKNDEKTAKATDDEETLNKFLDRAEVLTNSLTSTLDPMVEMSMISSLVSSIKSFAQGDTQALSNMLTNMGKSYINQYVPTLLGQIAKITDTVERDTTSTKSGTLSKAIDGTINQVKSKLPGLRQTLPVRTDIWGEEQKLNNNWAMRFLEAGILPMNIKNVKNNTVVNELNKLYDRTGESSILPTTINKKITIDGQNYRLTNQEYNRYKTMYGRNSYKLINELVNLNNYNKMTDIEKQTAIEEIYTYVKEQNKIDYCKNNKLEYKESTLSKVVNKLNGEESNYFEYRALTKDMKKNKEKINVLVNASYSDKAKKIIYKESLNSEDKKIQLVDKLGLPLNQYLKYKQQEFENDKDVDGETISGTKKQKVFDYLNSIPDKELSIIYKQIICKLENINNYNSDIVNYVIENANASDKKELLEILGFKVDKDGFIKNTTILPITKNIN